jgi:serine/threonine protein phosphatase 1
MKRDFVISDVHGMYFELVRLLKAVGFDPARDTITVLGDYIDRGTHSNEVLRFFMDLKRQHPPSVMLLKGNHEDMCVQAFRKGGGEMTIWMANGGNATLESFHGKLDEEVIQFIDSLPLFYETEDCIFVHGGIDHSKPLSETDPNDLLWNRCRTPHYSGKTVVVGHSIHENVTFYPESSTLCIDTGACRAMFGRRGKLSIADLTNKKVHWVTTGGADSDPYEVRNLEIPPYHHCMSN